MLQLRSCNLFFLVYTSSKQFDKSRAPFPPCCMCPLLLNSPASVWELRGPSAAGRVFLFFFHSCCSTVQGRLCHIFLLIMCQMFQWVAGSDCRLFLTCCSNGCRNIVCLAEGSKAFPEKGNKILQHKWCLHRCVNHPNLMLLFAVLQNVCNQIWWLAGVSLCFMGMSTESQLFWKLTCSAPFAELFVYPVESVPLISPSNRCKQRDC